MYNKKLIVFISGLLFSVVPHAHAEADFGKWWLPGELIRVKYEFPELTETTELMESIETQEWLRRAADESLLEASYGDNTTRAEKEQYARKLDAAAQESAGEVDETIRDTEAVHERENERRQRLSELRDKWGDQTPVDERFMGSPDLDESLQTGVRNRIRIEDMKLEAYYEPDDARSAEIEHRALLLDVANQLRTNDDDKKIKDKIAENMAAAERNKKGDL